MMKNQMLRTFWRSTVRNVMRTVARIRMDGTENIPAPAEGPLIVICNHFSYLDPLIIMSHLPVEARYFAAIEMTKIPFFRHMLKVFDGIPVWRGQIDRTALQTGVDWLAKGGNLGIFPEGGIIPELQEKVARGEKIVNVPNSKSRIPARLAKARPGTAWIATRSEARILPVAMIGTELLESNLTRFPWKRTHVNIKIGKPFGPLVIDSALRGRAKRKQLDEFGDLMMQHIAELMPPNLRGPWVDGVTLRLGSADSPPPATLTAIPATD